VIEEHAARRSQGNAARPAFQQLYPEFDFQIADLPAERRLGGVQPPLGGIADAAFLGHRNEIAQMA
jgi:hypothetical protein